MAISLTEIEMQLLRDALIEYEYMTDSYATANLGPYSNRKGWKQTHMMVKTLRLRMEHFALKEKQRKLIEHKKQLDDKAE